MCIHGKFGERSDCQLTHLWFFIYIFAQYFVVIEIFYFSLLFHLF